MARKRHTAEEIVAKLRQVDVLMAQGRQVADAVRAIGVTEVTYYRWRNEYGGLKGDQVKRLKELETENSRLRRAVSDLTLDKLILAEAAKGNFFSIRGAWRKSFFENPHCRRSSCEALASLRGQRLAAS
jgi:putative transposase